MEPALAQEVQALLRRAAELDQHEDAEFGAERWGDELPEELRRREGRLAKIRAAKARLEQRARDRAQQQAEAKGLHNEATAHTVAQVVPGSKEQSNFTDPDSRTMKTKRGWAQAYNAQLAVVEASGLVLPEEVSAQGTDGPRLALLLDHLDATLNAVGRSPSERIPQHLSLDAGCGSERNLAGWPSAGWTRMWPPGGSAISARGSDPPAPLGPPCAKRCGRSSPPRRAKRSTLGAKRSWSRCTDLSNGRGASVSSSYAASSRFRGSSIWWRSPTTCSSSGAANWLRPSEVPSEAGSRGPAQPLAASVPGDHPALNPGQPSTAYNAGQAARTRRRSIGRF